MNDANNVSNLVDNVFDGIRIKCLGTGMQLLYVASNVCSVKFQLFKERHSGICVLNVPFILNWSIFCFLDKCDNMRVFSYLAISSCDILKTKPTQDMHLAISYEKLYIYIVFVP